MIDGVQACVCTGYPDGPPNHGFRDGGSGYSGDTPLASGDPALLRRVADGHEQALPGLMLPNECARARCLGP